jgi:hypothetical protein
MSSSILAVDGQWFMRDPSARCFVEDYIDAIKKTPAEYIPIAKFLRERMKCSDATS